MFQKLFSLPYKAAQKLAKLFRRGATATTQQQRSDALAKISTILTEQQISDAFAEIYTTQTKSKNLHEEQTMVSREDNSNNKIGYFSQFSNILVKNSEKKIDPKKQHKEDEENYGSYKNGWVNNGSDQKFLMSETFHNNYGIDGDKVEYLYYGIYFSVSFAFDNGSFAISYQLISKFYLKYVGEPFLVELELQLFLNEINFIINNLGFSKKFDFNFSTIEIIINNTKLKIKSKETTVNTLTLAIYNILVKRMELVLNFLELFYHSLTNNNENKIDLNKFALEIYSKDQVNKEYAEKIIYYPIEFYKDNSLKKKIIKILDLFIYTIMFLLNFTNRTPSELIERLLNNIKQKKILPESEVDELEKIIYQTSNQIKEIAITDNSLYNERYLKHS